MTIIKISNGFIAMPFVNSVPPPESGREKCTGSSNKAGMSSQDIFLFRPRYKLAFAINQRDMIDKETRLSGLKVQGSEVSPAAGNRTGQISDHQQSWGYEKGPSKGPGPRSAGGRWFVKTGWICKCEFGIFSPAQLWTVNPEPWTLNLWTFEPEPLNFKP